MMICKKLSNLKILSNLQFYLKQNFSSALYITGDKAQKTFSVLTPVVDFDTQLENKDVLVKNLEARKHPLDFAKIEEKWCFFQSVNDRKKILELTKIELGHLISALMKDTEKNKDEIEKLKLHSRLIKEDLKNVKDYFYELEEGTMLQILNLPNLLHEKTPLETTTVHSCLECLKEDSKCHMEIGKQNEYIEYINPFTCYFKADAALFEMSILNYFRYHLLHHGFTQFSNPDFCRSVVVEGCGNNYDELTSKVFMLEEEDESKNEVNRLHLCGAASLYSFMAYFTKHSVQQTYFPLKYFSLGKNYHPVNKQLPNSLFNLCQESAVSIFVATLEEEEDALEEITKQIIALYEPLGYHIKINILAASQLEKAESLRLSVQMYSNYLGKYVEIGNVSLYDSYISKRLLFTYSVNKERKYPKIVGGTLLSVPKILGCILENNSLSGNKLITDLLKDHMFV